MDRYRRIRIIGAGSFGSAWLVESNFSGKNYALKELSVSTMSEQDRHLALNEVEILSRLKHKNVVRYKEAFVHESKLYIAMEYAEKGDLFARIKQQNGSHFEEQRILEWFTQLCLALKHIHAQNILHRDLKTQNIFLAKDDVIKLGDFGIARVLDSTTDHAQTAVGTPYYLSPEICQHKPYNHKSDMWSLGCVLYELTTLQHPFSADTFSGLVIKILQGEYPPTPSCYGPLLVDLIAVLLNRAPEERPSAKRLLHVPAMRSYVEKYVSYDHTRINSAASEVRSPGSGVADSSPKGTSLSLHKAAKIKDIKRSPSEREISAPGRRPATVEKTSDRQREFSEKHVPSVKIRDTSKANVPPRKRSEFHSQRCSPVSKVKESIDSPRIFSPKILDVEIEVFPSEHPAASQLRESSDRAEKLSANCRNNAEITRDRSDFVAVVLKQKRRVVARRHRTKCDTERGMESRNLARAGSRKKTDEKCSVASASKENCAISVSSKKHRSSPNSGSTGPLQPINLADVRQRQSNQSRETGLRERTYTVLCDKCPCNVHAPTKEKESRLEYRETSGVQCEKEDELSAKTVDNSPPLKFKFCERTLELDNITTTDSSFACIEALRMFLESRLGTVLLADAYRYLTKVSTKEEENDIYRTLGEILGTESVVAYVPIILQLIACETMLYQ